MVVIAVANDEDEETRFAREGSDEPMYVTAATAAHMLQVTNVQILRLMKEGVLSWRPGADRRYKLILRKDVERYLEEHPLVPKTNPQTAA